MFVGRKNSDIDKVVIHHTGHDQKISGLQLNKEAVINGLFGSTFDFIINIDGNVDLSPRWIHAIRSSQFIVNAPLNTAITKYPLHHLSVAGNTTDLNRTAIHIALVGDFDISEPTLYQIDSLVNIIVQIAYDLQLCPNRGELKVFYDYEVGSTSCPGFYFLSKYTLDTKIAARLKEKRICQSIPIRKKYYLPPVSPYLVITNITSTTVTLAWGNLDPIWNVEHFNLYMTGVMGDVDGNYRMYNAEVIATPNNSTFTYTVTYLLPYFYYTFDLTATLDDGKETLPI